MFSAIRNLLLVAFLAPTTVFANEPNAAHTSAEW